MKTESEREMIIAIVVDAVEEAHVSMEAAFRHAIYLADDRNEEKRHGLEVELLNARVWTERALENVAHLKGEL